ncbi:MAG: trypsin-like peptidase domain-containing protein [Luteimonas sp.]
MRPLPTLLTLAAAAAFGGFAATAILDSVDTPAYAEPNAAITVPAVAALPVSVDGQLMPSLAPMLQRVTPSVVSVHSKQRIRNPFADNPVFRRMYPNIPLERFNESLGSGVIVDAQRGYVLTNHHVIEGAAEVSVTLADGRTLKAEFVGSDADTDVALMRIPAQDLRAIPLANSGNLQVGDFVVAVGNPFGVGQTVTSGIVSAVGRSNLPGINFQNFIQTDASINPGNSGGALVNLKGELVGINTASFNPQGSAAGNIGLGFAIPANLASDIMRQLVSTGAVRRGTLGIETQDVDARIAASLGVNQARGAVVTRVYPGSAAAAGGLQVGDVIVAGNDQRIDNSDALRNFQGLQAADARVTLDVLRNGRELQLVTGLREPPRAFVGNQLDPRLAGATFSDLPEASRRAGISGVIVEKVDRSSRAGQNNLRANDLIIASSSGQFSDLPSFRASFSRQPAELVLRVRRGNRTGDLLMQ